MQFKPVVVDLSHYDDVRDWDAVKQFGILGVINKATEGFHFTDPTYAVRRPQALKRGIHYGAYHFMRVGDPIAQADFFLKVALEVEQPDDLLLALDHEDPGVPLDHAKSFLQRVYERTGRRAVLYSGFLIKEQLGDRKDPFLADHRLWLADYCDKPCWPGNWQEPWLIQFTGDGEGPTPHAVPGIDRNGIDINHFGQAPDLLQKQWCGGSAMAMS